MKKAVFLPKLGKGALYRLCAAHIMRLHHFSFALLAAFAATMLFPPALPHAMAQNRSGKISFLKQKDFSVTLDALAILITRPAPADPDNDAGNNDGDDDKKQSENATSQKAAKDGTPPPDIEAQIAKIRAILTQPQAPETTPAKGETNAAPLPKAAPLPHSAVALHFASYADTRQFLQALAARFGKPAANCSRASFLLYRLNNDFTLRIQWTNLNPADINPGSSVDGANGLHLLLIDGALSEQCSLATLTAGQQVSSATLTRLVSSVINADGTLDTASAEKLLSAFGAIKREEKGCFIRQTVHPTHTLPHLRISLTSVKPGCTPEKGFAGLIASYQAAGMFDAAFSTPDPLMTVKMFRVLENSFRMQPVHNIGYLWKNNDIFGIIRLPPPPPPFATKAIKQGKISLEAGRWFGADKDIFETLWNAGNQPYGGMATSEEFIP